MEPRFGATPPWRARGSGCPSRGWRWWRCPAWRTACARTPGMRLGAASGIGAALAAERAERRRQVAGRSGDRPVSRRAALLDCAPALARQAHFRLLGHRVHERLDAFEEHVAARRARPDRWRGTPGRCAWASLPRRRSCRTRSRRRQPESAHDEQLHHERQHRALHAARGQHAAFERGARVGGGPPFLVHGPALRDGLAVARGHHDLAARHRREREVDRRAARRSGAETPPRWDWCRTARACRPTRASRRANCRTRAPRARFGHRLQVIRRDAEMVAVGDRQRTTTPKSRARRDRLLRPRARTPRTRGPGAHRRGMRPCESRSHDRDRGALRRARPRDARNTAECGKRHGRRCRPFRRRRARAPWLRAMAAVAPERCQRGGHRRARARRRKCVAALMPRPAIGRDARG